ncbi:MAG: peptidylprolyl isomerase [candidate division Zixibacteria bacterium]|nr:peptidylprolyl isomerase [candidate division Zixibacteria bacterium]
MQNMMKSMRKMTRSILWIVIAAFVGTIVFAWGMQFTGRKSTEGLIAVINGEKIPVQNFQYLYEVKLKEAEKGEEGITDDFTKNLREQVWSDMVDQTLITQEIKKRDITVTDKELYEFMKRFPPKEIMQSEVFLTNGKFDYNKYIQALSDPRIPWGQVEGYVRSQLLVAKLQENIIGAVRIHDQEVYSKYVEDTQKARVNYTLIPIEEFPAGEIEITQEEMQNYYKDNKDKFNMVERAIIKFIEFPKSPSKEDEEKLRARMLEIREEILNGADFGEMAEEYSQDQASNKKGGDLGWVKEGSMRNPFNEVAFALKPGEVSEPVRSEYSLHLIKVLEKRKSKGVEEARLSHLSMKIELSDETLSQLKEQIESFVQKARKAGLDKAAEEEKLTVKESDVFVKGGFIPNLGMSEEVSQFAFENKAGKISEPIDARLFFYVVQVKERRPAGIASFSESEPYIKKILINQKQYELAYEKGMKIYDEVLKGESFVKVVNKYNEKVKDSEEFSRSSYIPGIGQQPEFTGTAFALEKGNPISRPIKLNNGTYVLQLISKTMVDDSLFQVEKDSLSLDLLRKKQLDYYNLWFGNIKRKAKIEDFRDQYYRETY